MRRALAGGAGGSWSERCSGAATDATRSAAFRPSGDRATHSAASSAVAKQPRLTFLPPRFTRAW